MTMREHEERIAKLCEDYNRVLLSDTPDIRELTALEDQLKDATADAKNEQKAIVYADLLKSSNPMLEAARMYSYSYPAYKLAKEGSVVTGAEPCNKTTPISPVELTGRITQIARTKDCPFEKGGIVGSGHSWEYKAEKLAYMLTYRTIKNMDGDSEAVKEFKKSYAIRDLAAREKLGETPTSTTQLVKVLQSIIDLMVWVPNDKGGNSVKVNGRDANYLLALFEKPGRAPGVVEVLKGNKIKDYIFTVSHMVITGKAYEVKYAKKKENSEGSAPVRKPVAAKPVKVSEPDTIKVSRKNENEPAPATSDDALPAMDEIPAAVLA